MESSPNANPDRRASSDSAARFSDRAADYASARPGYPQAVIDAILDGFARPVVADLGAGTGISARALGDAGARVFAVEPNAEMRSRIGVSERVTPIAGTAESTPLAAGSVDIVTAFQAFHWFDRAAALREAARVARPRARFAAVWNHRNRDDAFVRAYERVIDRYGEENRSLDVARRTGVAFGDLAAAGWSDARVVRFPNVQAFPWDRFAAFVRSCSYLPQHGAAHGAMMYELRGLFDDARVDGAVAFAWVTEAYLADRQ